MKVSSHRSSPSQVVFVACRLPACLGCRASMTRKSRQSSSPPIKSTSMRASLRHPQSTSDEVKAFARLMVTDHTGVNKSATDLAAKLKVTPRGQPDQPEPEGRWRQESSRI